MSNTNSIDYRAAVKILALFALYYPFSIGLTFYNKWFVGTFRFPLLVVVFHYGLKFFSSVVIRKILRKYNNKKRVTLTWRKCLLQVAPIGFASSVDIALSNWSLEFITVSLYTMSKSSTIVFIVLFAMLLRLEKPHWLLIPIVAFIATGLFLFTYESAQFDLYGFLLVELAATCGGLRWTLAQTIMQKESMGLSNPVDMIYHVQPFMFLSILPLLFAFEGTTMSLSGKVFNFNDWHLPLHYLALAVVGGVIAFCMEISEYLLLVNTSSLTLCVSSVIKEILTLIAAHHYNKDKILPVNVVGLLLCLSGVILHAYHKVKNAPQTQTSSTRERSNENETCDFQSDYLNSILNQPTDSIPLLEQAARTSSDEAD